MNFTIGIIAAVGVLIAFSLVMISMDPSRVLEPPVKPVEEKPAVCTKEYLPVCGVDGITYGNNCMLDAAKIELDYSGECIEVKPLEEGWQRLESAQHQGVGHESHQAVVILPLGDKISSGTLQYAATEPVQLITLHGPLFEGEEKGQSTWTPDGVTKYALTFVDQQSASGEWIFSGNALLIHTKKTEPFMVDYKLDYTEKEISEYVKTGTILSQQDPALGHESHQLAMIIEPTSEIYSGILSYSASEPVQLVSLRGPLGPTERPVAAWSPDGQTIYALTLVDSASKMDSWKFSGNALAVHTMNTTQFTVTYSVSATAESLEIPKITTPIVPMNHTVSIPQGVASPGCETASECYLPNSLEIRVHDTVIWSNDDTAAHTVSSGNPIDGIDGKFDSSLFMSGTTFAYTFDEAGEYSYYCMVHPWMTGQVVVNEIKDMIVNEIAVDEPAPETVPTSESTLPEIVQDNSTQSEISVNATESTHISEPETEISEPVNATDSVPMSEKRAAPVEVMIAQGSGTPGCDATLECYLPHQAEIYPNEPVVWLNPDSAPHTITSGVPGTPDGLFDSGMLMSGQSWEFLFTESGDYDYYCMVHPWMTGKVTVI